MRKKISAALVAAAALATLGLVNTGSAAASEAQGEKFPCGFYTNWANWAYYGHCGSGWVEIEVKRLISPNDRRCVGPGTTHVGYHPGTTNAVYTRKTCTKPR
ncbi:DUF6355 family natural product biosynthesis protein [Allokutzneria sp. NRRL B-24872]|uniref:DUF6355 family natural product biosynthesis protein n=1 Tax=Allokutzneria sp. NRRL B-24872 TaxID=1137961 RepID=UPI000A3B1FD5|nr:DUF6355 family natural product biosynthesis protein [Allokutzneria sp. NRRL B-24872]